MWPYGAANKLDAELMSVDPKVKKSRRLLSFDVDARPNLLPVGLDETSSMPLSTEPETLFDKDRPRNWIYGPMGTFLKIAEKERVRKTL
jgi:hypothetical protein